MIGIQLSILLFTRDETARSNLGTSNEHPVSYLKGSSPGSGLCIQPHAGRACGCSGLNHAGCAAPRPPSSQLPISRAGAGGQAGGGAPKEAPGALKFEL